MRHPMLCMPAKSYSWEMDTTLMLLGFPSPYFVMQNVVHCIKAPHDAARRTALSFEMPGAASNSMDAAAGIAETIMPYRDMYPITHRGAASLSALGCLLAAQWAIASPQAVPPSTFDSIAMLKQSKGGARPIATIAHASSAHPCRWA